MNAAPLAALSCALFPVLVPRAEAPFPPDGALQGGRIREESTPTAATRSFDADLDELLRQLDLVLSPAGELALRDAARRSPLPATAGRSVTIDFDQVSAPCLFMQTKPLAGSFLHLASFFGREGNGGTVLDQCSNFLLNARSQPNFLAFNDSDSPGVYPSGGVARLPELLLFGEGHTEVTLYLSHGGFWAPAPLSIVAFGPGGIEDMEMFVTTNAWVAHTLSGTNIAGIVLLGNPCFLVVDDVSAD